MPLGRERNIECEEDIEEMWHRWEQKTVKVMSNGKGWIRRVAGAFGDGAMSVKHLAIEWMRVVVNSFESKPQAIFKFKKMLQFREHTSIGGFLKKVQKVERKRVSKKESCN
jgi:hypothetical protein